MMNNCFMSQNVLLKSNTCNISHILRYFTANVNPNYIEMRTYIATYVCTSHPKFLV